MKFFPYLHTVTHERHLWSISSDQSPMVLREGEATTLPRAMAAIRKATRELKAETKSGVGNADRLPKTKPVTEAVRVFQSIRVARFPATTTKSAHFRFYTSGKGKAVARMSENHPAVASLTGVTAMSAALVHTLSKMQWCGMWVIGHINDGDLVATCVNETNTVTIHRA